MTSPNARTVRYARAWVFGPDDVSEDEITLDRDGRAVPATVVRPRGRAAPLPAWVVLHGITRPGRSHAQLVRFSRALASAGLLAIIPDVPEWRKLSLSPHLSKPTIAAAIRGLRASGLARDEPVGLMGFSFGAPHAIAAGGDPDLADEIAGVAGFGGYGEMESTFRFLLTGAHEWEGQRHRLRVDPYGRWIVLANYLTAVPGYEDASDVADALRALAAEAGDVGAASWDPIYDPAIDRLRMEVHESRRALFDRFAERSDARGRRDGVERVDHRGAEAGPTEPEDLERFVRALSDAARRVEPDIDPAAQLAAVDRPVHILHGLKDHLIPFTEAYRLRRHLARPDDARLIVTPLFGHAGQGPFPYTSAVRDLPAFARALRGLFDLV